MDLSADDLIKILLAILVGGAIGFEREFRDKAAGFRTLIFICLGSTLFTIFSIKMAAFGDARFGTGGDATRIASNIVAGVGFLGAGVILRDGGRVIGVTTAAAVWLVAALGMGIGAAEHALVLVVTTITIIVLCVFPIIEGWVNRLSNERTYRIVYLSGANKIAALEQCFREQNLRVIHCQRSRTGKRVIYECKVAGRIASHDRVIERLMTDPEIEDFRY